MGLMIRLRQQGAKNGQTYRLVLMDKLAPRDGKYLEGLGWYNPFGKEKDAELKEERIDHWLSLGATLSDKAESLVRRLCPVVIKKYDDKKMAKLAKKREQRKKLAKKKGSEEKK